MIFVRRAEQSNWKIERTRTEPIVFDQEVSLQVEETADDEDYGPVATASDDDEIIEESIEMIGKVLLKPISTPPLKKIKLSAGLPSSVRFTNYELERLDNDKIVINVTAATAFQPESGNYVFDTSFLQHRDSTCIYQCKYCVKAFSNSEFLLKHITAVHLCTICLSCSENYKSLNLHMQSHSSVICPFCGKVATSPTLYRQHLKKQHLLHTPSHIGILSV
jgi:lipopolysaccharide assembly outer membrane protein LptD (OstA)